MRTNLKKFFAFGVTTLVALAVASTAHADRRSSLAGNMLISDQDDIYVYPQLTLKYRNMVSFDYFPGASLSQVLGASSGDSNPGTQTPNTDNPGANNPANNVLVPGGLTGRDEATQLEGAVQNGDLSMGGAGLILFGQEGFAFGISSHREDIHGATPQAFLGVGDLQLYGNSRLSTWGYLGPNSPLPVPTSDTASFNEQAAGGPGGAFLDPLQLADLLLGISLAPDHSFGARLSVGVNSARIERLGQARENEDSWNTTALNLVLGYSLRSNFTLDLSLELGLAFYSNGFATDQPTPNYDDSASVTPSFSLSGRSMIPLAESVSLGVLGVVHVNSASFDNEFGGMGTTADSNSVTSSNFLIEAGAGPVYKLPDDTTIAAYGTLGFGSSNYDFDSGDQTVSTTALLLPGFKLAFEHWLWDWMAFRSGLSSRFYFQSQSREFDNDAADNISSSHTYYEFLWSAGVGFKVGNFELNGTLQTPFVTNGPDFLGGTAPGLFSLLNANYKF